MVKFEKGLGTFPNWRGLVANRKSFVILHVMRRLECRIISQVECLVRVQNVYSHPYLRFSAIQMVCLLHITNFPESQQVLFQFY